MPAAVVDTNLLVLLIVGFSDRRYISSHRRLKDFTVDDFDVLQLLLEDYSELLVTPNVLSETSNLIAYTSEPAKSHIRNVFSAFISNSKEVYMPSASSANRKEFIWLGLTDTSLLELAAQDVEVISADLLLFHAALAAGYSAINFNHYRSL